MKKYLIIEENQVLNEIELKQYFEDNITEYENMSDWVFDSIRYGLLEEVIENKPTMGEAIDKLIIDLDLRSKTKDELKQLIKECKSYDCLKDHRYYWICASAEFVLYN